MTSSDGQYTVLHWGVNGDIPVQADYDGDGITDYAVVRPSDGVWYFLESESGYQFRGHQGPLLTPNDTPAPADYNGDARTDIAMWFGATGIWHIVDSRTGDIRQEQFGQSGDTPVMSTSVFR